MSARGAKNILVGIAYNAYDPLTGHKVDRASEESVEQTAKEVLTAVTELGYSTFIIPPAEELHELPAAAEDAQRRRGHQPLRGLPRPAPARSQRGRGLRAARPVPFTGNDSRTLALCLNKFKTKAVLKSSGLPTAPAVLVESPDQKIDLPFPLDRQAEHRRRQPRHPPRLRRPRRGVPPQAARPHPGGLRRAGPGRSLHRGPGVQRRGLRRRKSRKPCRSSKIDFTGMPEGPADHLQLRGQVAAPTTSSSRPRRRSARPKSTTALRAKLQETAVKAFLRLLVPRLRPGGLPGGQEGPALHPRSQSQSRHQPERRVRPGTGRGRDRIQDVLEAADR